MRSHEILDSENYRYRDRVALLVFIEVTIVCKLQRGRRASFLKSNRISHDLIGWRKEREYIPDAE